MLGGANHASEFRLSSYVHMLRWWWRFLALGRFGNEGASSYWEAVLFGWHAKHFDNRAVFGLPHNYKGIKVGWDLNGENKFGRRASPLLFHFHRLGNMDIIFVASAINTNFAPSAAKLHVKKGNQDARKEFARIDCDLVRSFADFLRDPDATGGGKGVQYTSFNVENTTVAP